MRHYKNIEVQFEAFYEKILDHIKKKPSKSFLEWFIGFFEGDGSWIMWLRDAKKPDYKEVYVSIARFKKKKKCCLNFY